MCGIYWLPKLLSFSLLVPEESSEEEEKEDHPPLPRKEHVVSRDVVPSTTKQTVNNSWIQRKMYTPINGFVPVQAGSTFPPLSSTMSLVNEARRLCSVLPSLQVLTSSEVQKNSKISNAKPAGTFYRPVNYPSAVQLSTPFHPNTMTSPYGNVRAYTGFGVPQGSNFMHANPLKIVVKQVDSAKQQARVSRPLPTSDSAEKRTSNNEQSEVSNNMKNSSVPSFSSSDLVFSRMQGRDVASPPLLSANPEKIKSESSNVSKGTAN